MKYYNKLVDKEPVEVKIIQYHKERVEITKDNLKEVVEYVFRKKEDYTEPVLDTTLYIYEDSEILSFEYGDFTTGLEGMRSIYGSGIGLGVMDINYNGKILSEDERKSLLSKLFRHKKDKKWIIKNY